MTVVGCHGLYPCEFRRWSMDRPNSALRSSLLGSLPSLRPMNHGFLLRYVVHAVICFILCSDEGNFNLSFYRSWLWTDPDDVKTSIDSARVIISAGTSLGLRCSGIHVNTELSHFWIVPRNSCCISNSWSLGTVSTLVSNHTIPPN